MHERSSEPSLQIVLSASAHDEAGRPTYRPADPSNLAGGRGLPTFRQLAFAGDFEGYTTFGLGVRARLAFRVFVLTGPGSGSRVVVDVSHRMDLSENRLSPRR